MFNVVESNDSYKTAESMKIYNGVDCKRGFLHMLTRVASAYIYL